jgi:hypothetical protein
LAEEFAEDGAGGDVGVAIAVEGETVGAGALVGGEGGFPSDRGQALRVVGYAPDVYVACGQAQGTCRVVPFGGGRGGHGGILCQMRLTGA